MKLFVKYNRLNITATIIIFLIGSTIFYFLLNYILIEELDHALKTERQEIVEYNNNHNALPEVSHTKEEHTAYFPADRLLPIKFSLVNASYNGTKGTFREISFGQKVLDKYYRVVISLSFDETAELLNVIIFVTVIMIALILITGYFFNRSFLVKLWKPFYATIQEVKEYDVAEGTNIAFQETDIDEFALLNKSIRSMTERVQGDYQILKDFTGLASHEMQTPLAIIRNRLDIIVQNEALLQHNANQIIEIENAVQRLSRLNQSLLLLTKVENRQFILDELVSLDELILEKCSEFMEMIDSKGLTITVNIDHLVVKFHQHLSEIIISNLLKNAIKYNVQNGIINILLKDGIFTISNTSEFPELDKEKVFTRFYRYNKVKEEGNGLGLSIVKQICDVAGLNIQYLYASKVHVFSIDFNSAIARLDVNT